MEAYGKHFKGLIKDYKELIAFSLLSHSKSQEDYLK